MPLLDIPWELERYAFRQRSFLGMWAAAVADALNRQCPDQRFFAELMVRTRLKTEQWVAGFEHGPSSRYDSDGKETGERYPSFEPPPASFRAPARFTDRVGVDVIDHLEGPHVGGAVHFVCPGHRESSDAALAFATRCAARLFSGAGVVVIDLLGGSAKWASHFHSLTAAFPARLRPPGAGPVALAVRSAQRSDVSEFDVWHFPLTVGQPLPTVPLALRGAMFLALDLESTFTTACKSSRIP